MPRVSQALIDFANQLRWPAAPGTEIIETPRYRITLQPDFPIPGPNSVAWVRCASAEAGALIDEVRAIVAPRRIPIMWTLDPDTEPADFADHLAARGVLPDPHGGMAYVMVLSATADVAAPDVPGLELRDGLADLATYRLVDAVNAEAFKTDRPGEEDALIATQERRRLNQVAAGNRRVVLVTVDGEPAGSAGLTLLPPQGAALNGGAVRPKFRGRGVYRAMVAARLEFARQAGVEGVFVWGGRMSAPILERLGFEKVGWRKFYVDTTTA